MTSDHKPVDDAPATEQQPAGGFVIDPTQALPMAQDTCCGEPADSAGATPGGQSGGCCGEPAAPSEPPR